MNKYILIYINCINYINITIYKIFIYITTKKKVEEEKKNDRTDLIFPF